MTEEDAVKTQKKEEEKPDILTVQITSTEVTVGEELEIGDFVTLSVRGTVKEKRDSRYWDRKEDEEMSKRKYMIEGSTTDVLTKEHSITVTPEAEEKPVTEI